jgi:superfamily II DNA or RNA helicase
MLADKEFQYSYSHIDEFQPADFCNLALANSRQLDLGLGYFSSASFNVLAHGMARFIMNGGCMNLYINKYVSKEDYELLKGTHDNKFDDELLEKYNQLVKTFESRDIHFFQCLAYLIQQNRINIRIVVLANGGLPHEKYGIFTDELGNKIYFNGSMNMTAFALLGNLETIECTCSWKGEDSKEKVNKFESHFHKVWNGDCNDVLIYEAKKFCTQIQQSYPDQDPELLLLREESFVSNLINEKEKATELPHFPSHYKDGALPYQEDAYQAWIRNGKRGIFAMATGTGKTVTALNCALHEYATDKSYRLLILVPTLDLVEQWIGDLKDFNYKGILTISSLNPTWRKDLLSISQKVRRGKDINFAIVSTYDSFVHKDFQMLLPIISDDLILIADEAHNIGGNMVKACFKNLVIPRRIALSATPERIYDDAGTADICGFFNDKPPYVYSYPMSKAIEEKRLCKYYYFPKVAYLNEGEMERYSYLTKRLVALWDESRKQFRDKAEAEKLLMNRKRIIHKCEDKLRVYREILTELGEQRLKYTFVYAPQGKYERLGIEDEVSLTESDDISFIQKLLNVTKEVFPNIYCNTFTGVDSKATRNALLKAFGDGTLNVLLAMKCLDEGVNVPRAEIGIFTSSTGNPREFIQRRGRLLRLHKDKKYSYIYDIIVIPDTINQEQSFSKMESNLVRSELQRVAYFSSLAMNCYAQNGAYEVLNDIAHHFGIIWSELLEHVEQ